MGRLGYRLWRDGDTLHLNGKQPPAGFVLTWPLPGYTLGATRVNGQPTQWRHAQLRMRKPQANVAITLKKAD